MLGKVFLVGKATDRAKEKAEWVLHREPDHPDALLLNAAVLLAERDDENARLQLENIRVRGVSEPDLFVMLASIHTRRNDYDMAIAVLQEGIAANPDSARLLTLLARLYDVENRSNIAIETIRKVILIEPQQSGHRLNLADLLWKSGRQDEARILLTELAAEDPVEVDNVVRVAHFFIAKNQLSDAETVLKESIRNTKKNFALRLQLGELYLNTDRPKAAISLLDESLHIEKDRQLTQYPAQLRRLPHLLAQFAGPGVGFFHFWGWKALGAYPSHAEGELQREFLLSAFGGVRQGHEQSQRFGQMSDPLLIGGQLQGPFSGQVQIMDRLLG